jgi:hypothetical protein
MRFVILLVAAVRWGAGCGAPGKGSDHVGERERSEGDEDDQPGIALDPLHVR